MKEAIAFLVLLFVFSLIIAKDSESVYETRNCVNYDRDIRYVWWSFKPTKSVDYTGCGSEKVEIMFLIEDRL